MDGKSSINYNKQQQDLEKVFYCICKIWPKLIMVDYSQLLQTV